MNRALPETLSGRPYDYDYPSVSYNYYPQHHRTSPPSPARSPPPGGAATMWYRLWRTHLQQSSPHLNSYTSPTAATTTTTNTWKTTRAPLRTDRRTLSVGTVFRVGFTLNCVCMFLIMFSSFACLCILALHMTSLTF